MPNTSSMSIRLLELIKRFPELYDSKHDLANDKAHSMVVWNIISCELDTPVSVLKKKWRNLRSTHLKKCKRLRTSKSATPLPPDHIFHLIHSMLIASEGDLPDYEDDSSQCPTPTSSIVSGEGRLTRSSSTSTMIPENSAALSERRMSTPQTNSAESNAGRNTSRRILRSSNLKIRADKSGGSEVKDDRGDYGRSGDSKPPHVSTPCPAPGNRGNTSGRIANGSNEPVRTFFQSMALTVSGFPQHVQAATKTKICNVVFKVESGLAPPPPIR